MMSNPVLHRLAIYEGIKAEEVSALIESILYATVQNYTTRAEVDVRNYVMSKYPPAPVHY